MTHRTAVRAKYALMHGRDRPETLQDVTLVVDGDTITDITREKVTRADKFVEVTEGLILPGFINLHNHALNGPTLKAITDDYDRSSSAGSLIYKLLMPLGDLSTNETSQEDIRAIFRLALLEILKSGTTTMLDMWRPAHQSFLDVTKEMGLRAYAAPYLQSTPPLGVDGQGLPVYGVNDEEAELAVFRSIFEEYDEGPAGRIRVVLGPHGTDTCSPELLQAVRRTADELDTLITIHAAQSRPEAAVIGKRYGLTPIEYLKATGITGPDVIAAHCVHASDADLTILRETGTSVAHCPLTFARGGQMATYQRFVDHGIRVGIGTDGYGFDYLAEMRSAGFISKLSTNASAIPTAAQLIRAGTLHAADALGRTDLGRIAVGAKADLTVIDLGRAGLQPVRDPLKTALWYASAPDISTVIVDGRVLVENGTAKHLNEQTVISAGADAVARLWERAERLGIPLEGTAVPHT